VRNSKTAKPAPAERVRIVAPYPFTYSFRVKPPETGKRLLPFLLERFPFRSSAGWQERIADGRILRNHALSEDEAILAQGDLIFHHNPRVTEPSVPDAVRVLHETPDYLIAYKPAPMPVHPGGRYSRNTLIEILREMGYGDLHIIHRLDSVTSGLMLLGKTVPFSQAASLAFKEGGVTKAYHALVTGTPEKDVFSCRQPIMRAQGYRFRCDPAGKEAHTSFRTIERGQQRSIVECEPLTGRTHQIRLHLAWLGIPIANDEVYLPDRAHTIQNTSIFLQSSVISIPALDVHYSIDLPPDWHALL